MKNLCAVALLSFGLLACQKPVNVPTPSTLGWSNDGNYLVKEMDFKRLEEKIQNTFQNDSVESMASRFPFLNSYIQGKGFTFASAIGINADEAPQVEVYKVDSLMDISDEALKQRLEQVSALPTSGRMASEKSNMSGRFLGFAYSKQGDYLGFCMTQSTELIDIPTQKPLDFFGYWCDQQPESNQNPIMPTNLTAAKDVWRPIWSSKNLTIQRISALAFTPKKVFYIYDLDIGPFVWMYTSNQKTKFFSPKTQKSYTWVDQNAVNSQSLKPSQISKSNLALDNSPGFLIADK